MPEKNSLSENFLLAAFVGRNKVSELEFFEQMDQVLSNLSKRHKKALELRFGLKDGNQRTFKKVGEELGVTGGRARGIVNTALQELREPGRLEFFNKIAPVACKEIEGLRKEITNLTNLCDSVEKSAAALRNLSEKRGATKEEVTDCSPSKFF